MNRRDGNPAVIWLQAGALRCWLIAHHMKSAYELAMERLAKSDPSAGPLTAEQKAKLAEIDKVYKGKLAEREIFLKKQVSDAMAAQKFEEIEKIREQMGSERIRLEEEKEQEKEKLRQGFASRKS
jgi:hypothetical protein